MSASSLACILAPILGGEVGRGIHRSRVPQVACIVARVYQCSHITGGAATKKSRVSLLAWIVTGSCITPRGRSGAVHRTAHGSRVYRIWQVYHRWGAVSDHTSREPKLARIIAGRFITPMERFRITGRVDHSSRVPKMAGLSPQGGGFGSQLARITAGRTIAPEQAVSDQISRVS